MTTHNIKVRVQEDNTWEYVKPPDEAYRITVSMEVDFALGVSPKYTVTIDGEEIDTVAVADTVDMARLTIRNKGSSDKQYTFASSSGYLQRHMKFPAASHTPTRVDVQLDGSAGAPVSADLTSETGDPKFTIRPAKPPPSSTEGAGTGSFDATLVWDGATWSTSSLVCAVGGRLDVHNTSDAMARIVMKNDRHAPTSSGIEIDLKAGGSAVLDFGYPSSGEALAFEGSIAVGSVTASVDVVYASYFTSGQLLRQGASLRSPNGTHVMIMRFDSNLCVYPTDNPNVLGSAQWCALQTQPAEGESFLELDPDDGELRIVSGTPNSRGTVMWRSGKTGQGNFYYCAMDDDGDLGVYEGHHPIGMLLWSSNNAGANQ